MKHFTRAGVGSDSTLASSFLERGLLLAVLVSPAPNLAAQGIDWLHQHGTFGADATWDLVPDGSGGAITAGERGGFPFAPEDADAFVIRYGPTGSVIWERRIATSSNDRAYAVAADGANGAFVAGFTNGSLAAVNGGQLDVWYARYDASGNLLWIRQIAAPLIQVAHAAVSDGARGVYLAGSTTGPFGGNPVGMADIWLGRYDSAGNQVWIRQLGSSQPDLTHEAALAPNGDVFLCGETYGDLVQPSAGGIDAWLARFDGQGNTLWVRQLGTSATDFAEAISSDGGDGAFVVGTTLGALGGPPAGINDAWIAHFDGFGNQQWLVQLGTNGVDTACAVVADGLGGLYVSGDSSGDLGGPTLGSNDVWIAKFDALGAQQWMSKFGGPQADLCATLALDGDGGFLLGGATASSLGGPVLGDFDAWTARFVGPCGVISTYCTSSTTSIPGCKTAIEAAGSPSITSPSSFSISSGNVPGGNLGICILSGSGSTSLPFGTLGGKICVQGPIFRSAPKGSGGGTGQCNGNYTFTLAELMAASPIVASGATIHAQVWARDPANPDGFLLSNAIEFTVCP